MISPVLVYPVSTVKASGQNLTTSQDRINAKRLERRARRKREVRQAILAAAILLFEREGIKGFSVRRVAEATGYSPTAIYLYFENHDDLLFEVARQHHIKLSEGMRLAYEQHQHPIEQLRAMAREYVQFGLEHPQYYQVLFMSDASWFTRHLKESIEAGKAGEKVYRTGHFVERALAQAMEHGLLQPGDPVVVYQLFWSGLHGILSLQNIYHNLLPDWNRTRLEQLAEQLVENTLRGLMRS